MPCRFPHCFCCSHAQEQHDFPETIKKGSFCLAVPTTGNSFIWGDIFAVPAVPVLFPPSGTAGEVCCSPPISNRGNSITVS
jgi:hypothetical protein